MHWMTCVHRDALGLRDMYTGHIADYKTRPLTQVINRFWRGWSDALKNEKQQTDLHGQSCVPELNIERCPFSAVRSEIDRTPDGLLCST